MTAISQPTSASAPTAQELFQCATSGARVDYALYWCLNKMAYFNVEGGTNTYPDRVMTTFSRWVSRRDAEFVLDKIHFYSDEHFSPSEKVWWHNRFDGSYTFYHTLPNGNRIEATICRSGINGNRQLIVTHCQKH